MMVLRPRWRTAWTPRSWRPAVQWTIRRYDVSFPANVDARVGRKFRVTVCPFDPALVGVELRLVDVPKDCWQILRLCVAEVAG